MKAIIVNDVQNTLKQYFFTNATIVILYFMQLSLGIKYNYYVIFFMAPILVAVNTLNLFYYSSINNSEEYLIVIARKKTDLVKSRYSLALLYSLVSILLQSIIIFFALDLNALIAYLRFLPLTNAIAVVFIGLSMPFYFKFDYDKAKIFSVATLIVITFVVIALNKFLFGNLNYSIFNLKSIQTGVLLLMLSLIFYIISCLISYKIFIGKDV